MTSTLRYQAIGIAVSLASTIGVAHAQDVAQAWSAAGNRCGSIQIENANHFEVLEGFKAADGVMTRTALALLDAKLP